MKRALAILLCFCCTATRAQVTFKMLTAGEPIVAGESFRVQFVVEGAGNNAIHLIPPPFSGFRFVNGPEEYTGLSTGATQNRFLKNMVYTLKAIKPGRYRIPGAVAGINGKNYKSNDAWIEVISREDAARQRRENGPADDFSAYYLSPGEDPHEKIGRNLFVKVLTNKKTCYVGEPVVATFKLYSRLASRSEIIKNPGFYGFTVHDMISLADKVVTTETVNGQPFDVHIIRKVQLYPLQAGIFTIDPLEINNKVEFSRSAVSRRAEQKITEGTSEDDDIPSPGTDVFERNTRTEPVAILVKPTPLKNRPDDFNAATGRFTVEAFVEKKELAKNEQGQLLVRIKGKGNFTQIEPLVIKWPEAVEGFDPLVSEELDRSEAPLKGSKTFRYTFISSKPGNYPLPEIRFSYFDPDTNTYRTVSASPGTIAVSHKEKESMVPEPFIRKKSITDVNRKVSLVAAGIVVGLVLIVLLYWMLRKKEPPSPIERSVSGSPVIAYPSADEIIKPAILELNGTGKDFYSSLYHVIWNHLGDRFGLAGTAMNKQTLSARLDEIAFAPKEELLNTLQHCETGMFTNAIWEENREELLLKVKRLLEQLPG